MIHLPDVWIPGAAADAILAEVEGKREAARVIDFIRRLKAIDSRLDCFLAERAYPGEAIRMGFYYVLRRNEDGTTTFWEIHDNGAYREPSDDVLEAFRKGDAARGDLREERYQQRKADERARAKKKEDRREAIEDVVKDELDYALRVQLPFSGVPFAKGMG